MKQSSNREPRFKSLLRYAIFFSLLVTVYCSLPTAVSAQSRDYFTEEEIELVREAQQIDLRMDVLTKAIDRRFAVLNINVGGGKAAAGKEWGELPKGSRAELLSDIHNILQKAVDDIDNLASRPDSMVIDPNVDKKKQKGFSELFPKAVHKLADAAKRYEPALKQTLDTTKDDHEKGLITNTIDLCDEIIASVSKLK